MSWNGYEHNNLLRNEGPGPDGLPRFSDVGLVVGADDDRDGRGLAVADFDNDGDLDLAINHNPGDNGIVERSAAALLRNDIGSRRSWLAVELRGTASNRDAVGARVTVETGGTSQVRVVNAGSSYASQHTQRLYFGLGAAEQVDRLTVRWPTGSLETFHDLAARQLVRVVEGVGLERHALPGQAVAGGGLTARNATGDG